MKSKNFIILTDKVAIVSLLKYHIYPIMHTLIIDTSTEKGLVAISFGPDLLFEELLPPGQQNSKYLLASIHKGFQTLNIKPEALGAVAVAQGPGSFTGIRVGASAAKGFALGLSIPLISFSSLSGFISEQEGIFASVIDAKVGGAYVLLQEKNKQKVKEISQPELVPLEKLSLKLGMCKEIIGPDFERLKIEKSVPSYPNASHLSSITYKKLQQKQYSLDGTLEIVYFHRLLYSVSP